MTEPTSQRLERISPLLVCPRCRTPLDLRSAGQTRCSACGLAAERTATQIRFGDSAAAAEPAGSDALLRLKEAVKRRYPGLYPKLIELLSPVYTSRLLRRILREVPPESALVLDLGSGAGRHHPAIINLDLAPYAEVDLVCSIDQLPLPDGAVDAIVSVAVLEHVRDPRAVVGEMLRVLRPGGRVYCYVPFMQGIHASPDDYQRYTPHGLEVLFGAFGERRVEVAAGPASGFLWLLQEWVALVLSFGSRRLFWIVYALMFAVVAPLKYVDALLVRHPFAANIASAFAIEARKAEE